MACILVTHEMGFARELADHIHFADKGALLIEAHIKRRPPGGVSVHGADHLCKWQI